MSKEIKFTIDGKKCVAKEGQNIVDAARENGVYIPTLCHFKELTPVGTCRICTVKVNGRNMAACTTPVSEGIKVDNMTPELEDMRKAIVEMLFVEGNHLCPSCEKSGSCDLQALAYRYNMMVPRFPYMFPLRKIDASAPKIMLERNRCIMCKRCVRGIQTDDGKNVFAFAKRGNKLEITIAHEQAAKISDELAQKAMDLCPVGAIIRKGKGFDVPIGQRKYDKKPIGSDIESGS